MKSIITAMAFAVVATTGISSQAFASDASEGGIALNLRPEYQKNVQTFGFRPKFQLGFKSAATKKTKPTGAFSQHYSQPSDAGIAPTFRNQ